MTIRHSDTLQARCAPEIVERVERAAANNYMKPSEYVRLAIIDRLKRDGIIAGVAKENA